jgi:hypothetical protein
MRVIGILGFAKNLQNHRILANAPTPRHLDSFARTRVARVLPLALVCVTMLLPACGKTPETTKAPQKTSELESHVTRLDAALAAVAEQDASALQKHGGSSPVQTPASDADFVRRAYLDAAGRLPSAEETRRFLQDTNPDKHTRLVDALLESADWGKHWFNQLASLFRLQDEVLGASQSSYVEWFRKAAAENTRWDALAMALLTAEGDLESNSATGYLLRDHGWMTATSSETLRVFLGVDMHCAACHDHPFTDWTQMQFLQAAACLGATAVMREDANGNAPELWPARDHLTLRDAPLAAGERLVLHEIESPALRLPNGYLYRDGKPGDWVKPALLKTDRHREPPTLPKRNDLDYHSVKTIRQEYAAWLAGHPRFGETFALRLWNSLFSPSAQVWKNIGQETVEGDHLTMAEAMAMNGCTATPQMMNTAPLSLDSYAALNPGANHAAHTALLTALREIVIATGYDAREITRVLMHTRAYRSTAIEETDRSRPLPFFTAAPRVRRLSPEQLWDSLLAFAGDTADAGWKTSDRMPSRLAEAHPLHILGRGNREWSGEEWRTVSFGLTRFMHQGPLVSAAARRGSALHTACEKGSTAQEKTTLAYLSVLNRPPTPREASVATQILATDPASGFSSVLWALMNTSEFLFAG